MKLITGTKFIGALGLVIASTGACSAPTSDEAPTTSVSDRLGEAQRMGRTGTGTQGPTGTAAVEQQGDHLGPVALIGDALANVHLSDEQRRAVEDLGREVSPKEHAVIEARRDLQRALAEQLRSGHIDERALEAEVDALVRAREEASPALRKAFEDLHGILDERQRGELVDTIESRMQQHARDSESWFDDFARDLRLTEEQKPRVRQVLERAKPALEQDRDTATKVFDAFRSEEFSMDRIAPMDEVGKRTRARAHAMIRIAKELTDILTPEQLTMLADKIEPREQRGRPGQMQPQQPGEPQQPGMPGRMQPQQPGEPQQQEGEEQPVGRVQGGIGFVGGYPGGAVGYGGGFGGGGFGGGYGTGMVSSWGGGFRAGHMTVAQGGYAAGYPFIGGYTPGIW